MPEEAARLLIAALMLGGAAVSDLRTRRVPNRYWFPFAGAALFFVLGDLRVAAGGGAQAVPAYGWNGLGWDAMAAPHDWAWFQMRYLLALALALAFYVFWRIHLFGGADAKGLMVLAFLVPHSPPGHALEVPYTVAAILNGAGVVVLLPLAFLAWNVARGDLRLPAALLGVRMDLAQARGRHVWPMQRVDDDGQLAWRWWQRIGGDLEDAYARLEAKGVTRVWVTPKIPFLLWVLAGLAAAVAWGNLVVLALEAALVR